VRTLAHTEADARGLSFTDRLGNTLDESEEDESLMWDNNYDNRLETMNDKDWKHDDDPYITIDYEEASDDDGEYMEPVNYVDSSRDIF
jgi:hypothetical protein